jgi:hypothetical protein
MQSISPLGHGSRRGPSLFVLRFVVMRGHAAAGSGCSSERRSRYRISAFKDRRERSAAASSKHRRSSSSRTFSFGEALALSIDLTPSLSV